MNERIKELSIKAGFPEWSNHAIEFELEQFAELIIQDLIDSMIKRYGDDDELPIQEIKLFVKEHFGVEEQVTEPAELHTCPYAEEIHGDYETLCDCDEEQTYQCAMDI